MKLALIQIFFTVTASLGLKSQDDSDEGNGLSIILTVWLVLTPCMIPFLHLLTELDASATAKMLSKVVPPRANCRNNA